MKILIFSDSHRSTSDMRFILMKEGRPDAIIHLGDGSADLNTLAELTGGIPVYQLQGNCDYPSPDTPVRLISYFEDVKFIACHGHSYNVKAGLSALYFAAKEAECDLALFGHTHTPFNEVSDGIRFFNPGSVASGRYGVLTVNGKTFTLTAKTY